MTEIHLTNRLINEIQIQSSLDHPSIVKLHTFFEDSESVYLLLELCEGGELFTHIQGPLSEEETRDLMTQLVDGVGYLHSKGIIHRDLKLGNLFLTHDKRSLKIGDFGLAAQLSSAQAERDTLCGTPNYISPEVLMRKPYGLSSDVWSIGCILYACLTGSPPFESKSVELTLKMIREMDFAFPPSVSDSAKELIQSCLLYTSPSPRDS